MTLNDFKEKQDSSNINKIKKNSIKEKLILHPYRTAELYLSDDSRLGIFGQIHPLLAKKLNISTNTYLFELNFELIHPILIFIVILILVTDVTKQSKNL